jgi:hypothetical protein
LELVGYGVRALQYLKGASIEETLSFYVWVVWGVRTIVFFGFLNVSNVCGLYFLISNDF